ncbi:polyamine-transporting ATPase 13A3-like, partial [Acipenser ruthenus]|uniref:polyamine-transporting ATPase 13A3-like n=1 Tax=Acipenser ruthenus TaxID=7906 RepID=UPI00274143BF
PSPLSPLSLPSLSSLPLPLFPLFSISPLFLPSRSLSSIFLLFLSPSLSFPSDSAPLSACSPAPLNSSLAGDWLGVNSSSAAHHNGTGQEGEEPDEHNVRNFENTTLFFVSSCQYLTAALVFSKGRPFRQPVYTNCLFLGSVLTVYSFLLLLLLYPLQHAQEFLMSVVSDCDQLWARLFSAKKEQEFTENPKSTQLELGDASSSYSRRLCCRGNRAPKAKYQRLAQELLQDPDWPPQPQSSTKAKPPSALHSGPSAAKLCTASSLIQGEGQGWARSPSFDPPPPPPGGNLFSNPIAGALQ